MAKSKNEIARASIKVNMPPTGILDPDKILNIIEYHKNKVRPRLEKLKRYYDTQHDILKRVLDDDKPNNKLIYDFPSYITDFQVGYFMGEKVSYSADDEKYIKDLEELFKLTEEQGHNHKLAKNASIYGYAYEMLAYSKRQEEKILDLFVLDPRESILVYDTEKEDKEKPVACITYSIIEDISTGKDIYNIEYINKTDIIKYVSQGEDNILTVKDNIKHPFQDIPVVEYVNNPDRMGDFENVISLIDAYNLVNSDDVNDIEYVNDAYLCLSGVSGFEEEFIEEEDENGNITEVPAPGKSVRDKLKDKVLILPDSDSKVEWLLKNINDTHRENVKNRLEKSIHKFSKTPDLNDESFAGNISGVAMKFKLIGTEQKIVDKEAAFRTSLRKRLELLSNAEDKFKHDNLVDITFSRNLPINLTEVSDWASKLKGIISDETLFSIMSFTTPQVEKERINTESEERKKNEDSDYMEMINSLNQSNLENQEAEEDEDLNNE